MDSQGFAGTKTVELTECRGSRAREQQGMLG